MANFSFLATQHSEILGQEAVAFRCVFMRRTLAGPSKPQAAIIRAGRPAWMPTSATRLPFKAGYKQDHCARAQKRANGAL